MLVKVDVDVTGDEVIVEAAVVACWSFVGFGSSTFVRLRMMDEARAGVIFISFVPPGSSVKRTRKRRVAD